MDMVKSMIRGSNSQQQNSAPDEASWLVSTLAKVVGTLAGLFAMLAGVFSLISITPVCIFSGAVLLLEGLAMTLIEAPCFCVFLDFSQAPSNFFDGKPHYLRATIYLFFSVLPFFICTGFLMFLACGLMLITSGLYLMKSLGRKASRSEMAANAISSLSTSPSAILVQNEAPMATSINKGSGFTGEVPSGVTY